MAARPPCQYGDRCYRTNPSHLANFSHPRDTQTLPKAHSTPINPSPSPSPPPPAKRTATTVHTPSSPPPSKKLKPTPSKPLPIPPPIPRGDRPQSDEEDDTSDTPWQSLASLNRLHHSQRREYYGRLLQGMFGVGFPKDFYDFFDFLVVNHVKRDGCSACVGSMLSAGCAASALTLLPASADLQGVHCCGVCDWLAGLFDGVERSKLKPWLHWRYFFDLPQLMTTFRATSDAKDGGGEEGKEVDGWHCGYWRDAPKDSPPFLVSATASKPDYTVEGPTMYHAVHRHLLHLRNVASNPKQPSPAAAAYITAIDGITARLLSHAESHGVSVLTGAGNPKPPLRDPAYLARKQHVLAPTLTGLGFVCPYDAKTDVGFRPLPMSQKALQAMLQRMQKEDEGGGAVSYAEWDGVQTLLTLAMDECDPGTVELFCSEAFCTNPPDGVRVVEGEISQGMRRAWEMMGDREGWRRCIAQHLKYRYRKTLSQVDVASRSFTS